MKKHFYLLLITFSVIILPAFAENKTRKKSDTIQVKDTCIQTNDSLRSVYMYIPNDSHKKVITMKPPSNAFTYILPIITLLLGIIINRLLDYFSSRRKSIKAGKRWIAELRFLEAPIKQQIDAIDSYLQNQTESTFEIQTVPIYTSLDGEIFKTLDKSELLRYLKIKKRNYSEAIRVSNSTHGYINILIHTYEALKEKFETYLTETSSLTTSFSKNLNDLRNAYADFGVVIEKANGGQNPTIVNPEFAQLSQLMNVHVFSKMKTGKYNPFEMEESFFEPFKQVLSKLRLDDDAKPLMKYTSACLTDIAGLRMERHYLTENFKIISARYSKSLSELEKVAANLEKRKV